MTIHRRQFLHLCGIAGIGALAGCTSDFGDDGPPTPTGTSKGWTRQAKFTSDDVHRADQFGCSVAVSSDGTTAIIGAVTEGSPDRGSTDTTENPESGDAGTAENRDQAGAAYIFEASDGSWSQQAKLIADDGDTKDGFGKSVAMSGDGTTAVIGAYGDEDQNGDGTGSAYVFNASGGSWSQRAKLVADDGDSEDEFGRSVAVSSDGTTALIGAVGDEDPNGEDAGSAYVFDSSGGSWSQRAKLVADDGDSKDKFGVSVAMSGDGTTALVGAALDEDPNGHFAGSAYVFDASDSSWSQQAKLVADDGDSEDAFGWSVAVSRDGTTALIGAFGDEDPNSDRAGSAYVFEASGGSWSQQAKLTTDAIDPDDWFGRSVAMSGDGTTALVGAENKLDMNSRGTGKAYIFKSSGGSWSLQTTLPLDDDEGDRFGGAVAVSGDGTTSLIGDPQEIIGNVGMAGSAYVFTL